MMAALRDVTDQTRRQPVEPFRLQLTGDFEGWWLEIDRDLDLGSIEDLQSGDNKRIADGLGRNILAWNFVGKDGEPLPADATGVRRIGAKLFGATLEAFQQLTTVPNS